MELKFNVDALFLKQLIIEALVDAVTRAQAQTGVESLTAYSAYINSLANALGKVNDTMRETSVRYGHDR